MYQEAAAASATEYVFLEATLFRLKRFPVSYYTCNLILLFRESKLILFPQFLGF